MCFACQLFRVDLARGFAWRQLPTQPQEPQTGYVPSPYVRELLDFFVVFLGESEITLLYSTYL